MTRRRPSRVAAAATTEHATRLRMLGSGLILAVLLVYSNSLSNPFLLDDVTAVTGNPQIRQLWPLSMPLSPPDETPVANRPLVNLTFAMNYAVGGLDVRGYHVGNLAIHVLAALVLVALVRRTLELPRLAPQFGSHAVGIATASGLIWALHPLHTEIINYVSQRTAALMGLCYLLTLYCSLRSAGSPHGRWRVAAVAACTAGMASKETMVTAPVLVLLFDRVFLFGSVREAFRARYALYTGLAATWAVLAALMLSGGRSTIGFDGGGGAWSYLLNQFRLVARYLGLVFWPDALVVDYGPPASLALGDIWGQAMLVAGLAAASLLALWKRPVVGFAGAAFFILLSPTSSIVPIATEVGAERRMYLPLAAIVVLLVCLSYRGGARALGWSRLRFGWPPGRRALYVSCGMLLAVCLLLGSRVLSRNQEYSSPVALATVGVERWPHGRSYFTLGNALAQEGRDDEAIAYFRRSVEDFPAGHFALGTMLMLRDRDAGIAELRAFTAKMPAHPFTMGARQTIGLAEFERGRFARAAEELEAVVAAVPRNLAARALLGEALFRAGRPAEAVPHLTAFLQSETGTSRLHNVLGAALAQTGRLNEALVHFRAAVRLDPGNREAATNLRHALGLTR